ncbi:MULTISPECIES: hypothetical protein [Bacillaceae]|nr:hypothetical protein [Bacillus sp. S3]
MREKKKETVKIVTNEAIIGKPYLDIDRVIIEGRSADANHQKKE